MALTERLALGLLLLLPLAAPLELLLTLELPLAVMVPLRALLALGLLPLELAETVEQALREGVKELLLEAQEEREGALLGPEAALAPAALLPLSSAL